MAASASRVSDMSTGSEMNDRTRVGRWLGQLLYWMGVIVGLALLVGTVWADIESMFYGFDKMGDKAVSSLSCPLLITPAGTSPIAARFPNPSDREVQQLLRSDISGPLIKTEHTRVTLSPRESKRVAWTVTWEDVSYGMFVLVKISAYPMYPLTFRESSCGILALNVPFLTGSQLTAALSGLILVSLLAGLFLSPDRELLLRERVVRASYAKITLAGILASGLACSLLNWPVLAALLLLLAVLTAVSMLYLIVT